MAHREAPVKRGALRTPAAWLVLALALATTAIERPAHAHDFRPGVLLLTEIAPGEYTVKWTAPVDATGEGETLAPQYPSSCSVEGTRLRCGPDGLRGRIAIEGMHMPSTQVLLIVRGRDGRVREQLITGGAPSIELGPDQGRSFGSWIGLGVEHILKGYDHLAFVMGLLLVGGWSRRIIATITAFTLAHSLTLGLAATGVIQLASAPVEATIAASIILLAAEALRDRETLARRAPWLVALVFGLVHGLGFAESLRSLGLPESSVLGALLGFNFGIELGQLVVVGLALGLWLVLRKRLGSSRIPKTVFAYGLGALGSWWFVERAVAMFA